MFDFGDELTIQSYRIPWLIWIQILVMFLLILLLFCFNNSSSGSLFALDLSAASASPDSHLDKMPVFNHTSTLVSTRFQASQVGEEQSIKGEIAPGTGTSKGIIKRAEEESVEMEDCSGNRIFYHPCHYLKLAFLKCLGLDSSSSETFEQRKQR